MRLYVYFIACDDESDLRFYINTEVKFIFLVSFVIVLIVFLQYLVEEDCIKMKSNTN